MIERFPIECCETKTMQLLQPIKKDMNKMTVNQSKLEVISASFFFKSTA